MRRASGWRATSPSARGESRPRFHTSAARRARSLLTVDGSSAPSRRALGRTLGSLSGHSTRPPACPGRRVVQLSLRGRRHLQAAVVDLSYAVRVECEEEQSSGHQLVLLLVHAAQSATRGSAPRSAPVEARHRSSEGACRVPSGRKQPSSGHRLLRRGGGSAKSRPSAQLSGIGAPTAAALRRSAPGGLACRKVDDHRFTKDSLEGCRRRADWSRSRRSSAPGCHQRRRVSCSRGRACRARRSGVPSGPRHRSARTCARTRRRNPSGPFRLRAPPLTRTDHLGETVTGIEQGDRGHLADDANLGRGSFRLLRRAVPIYTQTTRSHAGGSHARRRPTTRLSATTAASAPRGTPSASRIASDKGDQHVNRNDLSPAWLDHEFTAPARRRPLTRRVGRQCSRAETPPARGG